jgi:hypothetical protein
VIAGFEAKPLRIGGGFQDEFVQFGPELVAQRLVDGVVVAQDFGDVALNSRVVKPPSSAAFLLDAPDELFVRDRLHSPRLHVPLSLLDLFIGHSRVRWGNGVQKSHRQQSALSFR